MRQAGGLRGTGADVDLTVGLLPCPSIPIYSSVCSGVWDRSLVVGLPGEAVGKRKTC